MYNNNQNWEAYGAKVTSRYPSESLVRFYMKYLSNKNNPTVLELGCGGGRNSNFLAGQTRKLTSIDFSKNSVKKAELLLRENKLIAEFHLSDILDYEFKKNKFDAIIDVSTLQHFRLYELKKLLPKIFSSLKDGGYFFSIFKNIEDYTYSIGEPIDINTRKFETASDKISNPCILSFLTEEDARNLFYQFKAIEINEERWTYDNNSRINSHWLLTLKK